MYKPTLGASEASTKRPQLQVLVGCAESYGLNIPTEINEKYSKDPVRQSEWKTLVEEHFRLFPRLRQAPMSVDGDTADRFSWATAFPDGFKNRTQIESEVGHQVILKFTGWDASVSFLVLAKKPTSEDITEQEKERKEALASCRIYAVANQDHLSKKCKQQLVRTARALVNSFLPTELGVVVPNNKNGTTQ